MDQMKKLMEAFEKSQQPRKETSTGTIVFTFPENSDKHSLEVKNTSGKQMLMALGDLIATIADGMDIPTEEIAAMGAMLADNSSKA